MKWVARLVCWLNRRAGLLIALLGLCCVTAQASPALVVDGRGQIALWPAVTLWADPTQPLTLEQALAARDRFSRHSGTPANLGRSTGTAWLRVPLVVPGVEGARRVLALDYPALNRIDVYLLQGSTLLAQHRLGNELHLQERPLPARGHAVTLDLPAGTSELLLHVQTTSSMVLPLDLFTPDAFGADEAANQLLHGLLLGLVLFMLAYSAAQWVSVRDTAFLYYAGMVAGNLVFMLAYSGIGPIYLWPQLPLLSQQVAPLGVLVAVAAGAAFACVTLRLDDISRPVFVVMRGISALALVVVLSTLAGFTHYGHAQTMATILGLLTLGTVMPTAAVRAWRGERVAAYMLLGWAVYLLGALTIAAMLRGRVAPGFWSQNIYPMSIVVEMATWLAILGLRVQALHRNADRARVESETLRAMAHTDALTGLPNRRGLQTQLATLLPAASPQQQLALYLLDLDGFKPVNDRHGHDVGDALLVAVGERLQAQLRSADTVARLGGDEFVVLAAGLPDEAAARRLGQKMLAAFDEPFVVLGLRCSVGITIGYALAPLDGHSADELLKRADAAMYAGKQSGRHCLHRGGRSLVAA